MRNIVTVLFNKLIFGPHCISDKLIKMKKYLCNFIGILRENENIIVEQKWQIIY
jgi:hypothetical protein